ncbi:aspartate/glutamate racemase family protein [Sphingosinicella rhizophila]|uniref:Amino acid racemase n=1 Tax=Sphingosinicella rhizophila TaxID=3050082 RepID=A0ABU3Q4F2_9SPHN|nr:amino acid racemase [Sphingosinicella sp. GR2756]MDT9598296.1 amino acid racemase [Sphingosinicella sp. GR2756]
MRKLGMIGGMSWASTAIYYDMINKGVARKLGGRSSAPLIIESYDFEPITALQAAEAWQRLGDMLAGTARRLQAAGAEGLILCTNTMHRLYDRVAGAVAVPILHIGDVTAEKLAADGVRRAGLIGTRFTMGESFYRERLEARGIAVATPDSGTAAEIDRIIFDELSRGVISRQSQRRLKTCLTEMGQARQQAVILGCTELVMLVDPAANVIPIYDTTALHSKAAVDWITA